MAQCFGKREETYRLEPFIGEAIFDAEAEQAREKSQKPGMVAQEQPRPCAEPSRIGDTQFRRHPFDRIEQRRRGKQACNILRMGGAHHPGHSMASFADVPNAIVKGKEDEESMSVVRLFRYRLDRHPHPLPKDATRNKSVSNRNLIISCRQYRPFAKGRMRLLAVIFCVLCVACSPTQKTPSLHRDGVAAQPALSTPLPKVNKTSTTPPIGAPVKPKRKAKRPAKEADPAVPPELLYSAVGTEPFWAVSLAGGSLAISQPGTQTQSIAVTLSEKGGVRRFRGDGMTMTVAPGPCSDGMSERTYPDRVQIAMGEQTLKGCGGDPERGRASK